MSFYRELKRRKVVHVATVYAVVAWLLVQVAATVEAPLGLPDWADTLVIFLLALGFPVALIMSWAFEITPDGLVRDRGSTAPQSRGRAIEYLLIAVVIAAVGWLVYRVELDTDSVPVDPTTSLLPNSVAVLPFENFSPNADDAYFAAGLHEEVLNQLAKLENLSVIARTTMRQYQNTDKSVEQVAAELNVASVMEGSVRYANGRVRVTAQLIDGQRGVHLWSDTYERDFEDIFAIESDIAMNVANAMAVEFSLAEQARIEEAPTGSPEAYALLLSSYEIAGRGTREATLLALERMDRALEVDPDFASGWAAKASMHSYITAFVPERTDEHLALGEAAAQRALELDPDSTGARISLAMIATARGQWQSAAREFAATSLSESEPLAAFQFLVGHFERGLENIRTVQRHDPLNPNAAWWIVAALDALGRTDASLAEYERARELFRDWSFGDFHAFVTLLGSGQSERAMALARDELANVVVATVLESSSSPEAALAALRRLLADDETAPAQYIALFAAHLGDQALALEALEAQLERSPVGGHLLWRPIFREMRQLPAFKDLLRQEGLVAYWGEFGWPDLCRPVGDGDFECD